jgi:hypothetical protein
MSIDDLVHLACAATGQSCATTKLSLTWYAGSLECAATELGCSTCPLPSAACPMALPCARAVVVGLVVIHSGARQRRGRSPPPLLPVDLLSSSLG